MKLLQSGKLESMPHTYATEALVLKRIDYGEADRIVTLFTLEHGKRVVLARGVRKISSRRIGSLEVGTRIKAMLIKTGGMEVLGQTQIISSFGEIKADLTSITQLYQLLEVVDILTRENQELSEVYELLVSTLEQLVHAPIRKQILLEAFKSLVVMLGFIPPQQIDEYSLKQYIEIIAEKKLNSKDFLSTQFNPGISG